MMRRFTNEELEILSAYEDRFYTAVNLDYYRNLSSRILTNINDIYLNAGGSPLSTNWSCGHCVLSFLRTVGAKYFKDKEAAEKANEEVVVEGYSLEIEDDLVTPAVGTPVPDDKAEEFLKVLDEVFADVPDEPAEEAPEKEEEAPEKEEEIPQVPQEPEQKPEKAAPAKKTNNKATTKTNNKTTTKK